MVALFLDPKIEYMFYRSACMNKTALGSIIVGGLVFAVSLILPYMGNKNFLWFTIDGPNNFNSSGTLYLISPAAMPLVLLLWFCAIYGLMSGYFAKKAGIAADCYTKVGTAIGIINVVLLGLISVLWPLFTWLGMGHHTSL